MTREEFKNLSIGDIIRGVGLEYDYEITGKVSNYYSIRVVGTSKDLVGCGAALPDKWTLVRPKNSSLVCI